MRYTEEYKGLQQQLHAKGDYGTSGHKHAARIVSLAKQIGTREVLDYGCGQRTLSKAMPFAITNYDPFLPGFDSEPQPHDLVVCSDVLEHIEPNCILNVTEHLHQLTKRALFVDVACRPAKKVLADGRNAHLIQWEPDKWLRFFLADVSDVTPFKPIFFQTYEGGFIAVLTK